MAYTDRFPIVKNFLETKLTADCDAGETTLYLENVDGLPAIISGRDYVPLVLRDAGTVREIVYVDAVDSSAGTVTVRRGQEGTTPAAWATGTYAYCTVTSDSFQRMRVNGFAPLVTDEGRPSISRTSATTVSITGDFSAQLEVGMAVRVLSGDTVVEPTDAEFGAIHVTAVRFSAGVTSVSFQNVSLPTKVDGLDLGLSVASAPLYHPDVVVADEDTLTQTQNVLSVSQKFKDDLKAELDKRGEDQAAKDAEQDAAIAEALDKVGLPLGFEYTRLTGQNAPLGGVDYMGQTATRAMYADLWAWLNENKPDAIISESEWQSLYSSQNGNVAKYSTGDGSTTFRFPRVVGYFKGAGSTDELGQYIKEGLPGHTHTRGTMDITGAFSRAPRNSEGATSSGCFENSTGSAVLTSGKSNSTYSDVYASFRASRSWTGETSQPTNPIYGASDHVTPETVTVVMGVIAIGSVASIGEATEEGIVAELGELEAELADLDESKADASALESKVSSINGTMTIDFENGSTIELRRAGDAGEYTFSVVYIAEDGTKKFGVLMNSEGEFLPGAFYAPNLSAGVGISGSTTYTVPKNGFVIAHVCSSNTATMTLKINGAALGLSQDDTGHDQICIPVKKGDTVYWSITSGNMNWTKTVTFYPAR